ncbi:MAG: hypothetical protein COB66_07045 [Coxiella sp. (in: Bacteria)]|nr:MAG: hypothetical protein COB66_07045 [Coxiella sp. (in: g-proteobacteria)]
MKLIRLTTCAVLLAASAFAFASGDGYDCTNNPPSAFSGGTRPAVTNLGTTDDTWGQCFLASAVVECQKGEMAFAPPGCGRGDIENETMKGAHHEAFGCHLMATNSIGSANCTNGDCLPVGVSEADCVSDLTAFVSNCKGDPVTCS